MKSRESEVHKKLLLISTSKWKEDSLKNLIPEKYALTQGHTEELRADERSQL